MAPSKGAGLPIKNPAELSLRERLALKANLDADKMPPRADPRYDDQRGMGKAVSSSGLSVLRDQLGQRRRRGGDGESDDDVFSAFAYQGLGGIGSPTSSRGAQQRPRGAGSSRGSPPAYSVPQPNPASRARAPATGRDPPPQNRANVRRRRQIADSDDSDEDDGDDDQYMEQSETTPFEASSSGFAP